jgi:hypothetical protein
MILLLLKAISYFYGLTLEITANFNTNILSIDPRLYVFTYTAHLQISEWFIGMHSCTILIQTDLQCSVPHEYDID